MRLPTAFTPFGVMLTFASTKRWTTEPELPCVLSVVERLTCVAGLASASPSSNFQDDISGRGKHRRSCC